MKTNKRMTIDELVGRFTDIALSQYEALRSYKIGRFNRLFDQMEAVRQELRAREGDQRRALMKLYDHPNPQVRLKAAVSTLAVAPKAAKRLLRTIARSGEFPQAGDAGMCVWALDSGQFKPT